jgi:lipopolysaccharide/colanic/teichoic acid biosynthesis glycosyltransferase
VKRVIDIALAGAALVVAAPIMAVIAVAVCLSSPGPVLFRQQRIGERGRPVAVLKFRTMRVNSDADVRWSVARDTRVTRVGRLLRMTGLDELPQLVNILRGDMSLVGPRPERPHFFEQFAAAVPGYEDRVRVPPGLTGWAQVNGLRGDTSIEDRARFDNHYIEHWSLGRDLLIIGRTIGAVARRTVRRQH